MLSRARVMEITEITSNHYYLLLEDPQMARESLPGQFLHIRIRESLAPFLRRPFSIAGASPGEGTLQIIFRLAGEGTRILSSVRQGEFLDCLGPLGSGFKPLKGPVFSVLVAGGVGVAPLLFLARTLVQEQKKVVLFYGASSLDELIPVRRFLPGEIEIRRATEDGSSGFRGLVTGLFEEALKNGLKPEEIFACGPRPMLQALAEKNKGWSYPMQLSLEERMACGIGACQGCAVKISKGEETGCRLVCRDGPVFHSHEVVW
ncbi:MAG: dihydroorotate dehydrogenase electron transfer subunit [Dethiobacter sp.]|nr:MAG: dihydroorotate dehydrogenase electron transfer subunit [Dethiobacter sp.]